jgi:hypothetical protein
LQQLEPSLCPRLLNLELTAQQAVVNAVCRPDTADTQVLFPEAAKHCITNSAQQQVCDSSTPNLFELGGANDSCPVHNKRDYGQAPTLLQDGGGSR